MSQKSGDSITLKANANYWGGAPKVPGVTFRFISEPSTALSALQAGEIDWTDSVPPQRVAQLENDDSVKLAVTPSNDYWYLALNEAREPWKDVRVRQAIAYAIDRKSIVQATSYGTATANQLAIPEGQPLVYALRHVLLRHRQGQEPAQRRPERHPRNWTCWSPVSIRRPSRRHR